MFTFHARTTVRVKKMELRVPAVFLVTISFLLIGFVRFSTASTIAPVPQPSEDVVRTPVLIELFTSEGCSSCPPADLLLRKLDQSQPVPGTQLIVLSEHVDYWNDIGWKDPYSSHKYSERQSAYAGEFGLNGVYTPQMVVDGRFELVGSDERRATQAIREAAKIRKAPVAISFGSSADNNVIVHVQAGPLPATSDPASADVFLAIADNSDESQVRGGENSGRTLRHVAVLRNLTRIGVVDASTPFSRDLAAGLNPKNPKNLRVVVIVQQAAAGRVLGAGFERFSN
jgi:hypothetical protein